MSAPPVIEEKRRQIVRRAEVALRELELDGITIVAKERFARVRAALRLLDDEQAAAKDRCDALEAKVERLHNALSGLLYAVRHWSGPAPRKVVAAGLVAEQALAQQQTAEVSP